MFNSFNEFLDDSTNKIQEYLSDSNIEKKEKEQILSEFSKTVLRISVNFDEAIGFDVDNLIRSISVRINDDLLTSMNDTQELNMDECDYYINICKRQRDNLFQFQNHPSWKQPVVKCNIDDYERMLIRRKNNLKKQKEHQPNKNLSRNYYATMDDELKYRKKTKKCSSFNAKKFLVCFVLICLLFLVIAVLGVIKYRHGRIKFPYSADYILKNDYSNISESLSKAGYTNIVCVEDTSGWEKEDSITGISVDGSEDFKKGSYYKPDTKIEIKYSSSKRIYLTGILANWQNSNYMDLVKKLEYAGFDGVKVEEVESSNQDKNNLVESIELDGQQYYEGECYLYEESDVILKYYRYKIQIGADNNSFKSRNYKNVISDLESKGFTDVREREIKTGWLLENTVVNVIINDSITYTDLDTFTENAKIVVEYSSNDRVDISDIMKNYNTSSSDELKDSLKDKGIDNVTIEQETTSVIARNQKIASVSIDGEKYEGDTCYIRKESKIIISYYYLECAVGKIKDKIDKDNYLDVKKELESKGFINITFKRTDDLFTGWINEEKKVRSILINGNDDFKSSDSFGFDVPIIIEVNTYKDKEYEGL